MGLAHPVTMDETYEYRNNETTPLLDSNRSKSPSRTAITAIPTDGPQPWYRRLAAHWNHWKICYICGLFVVLIDLGDEIRAPSALRMLEASICRGYYSGKDPLLLSDHGDVPELYCKVSPIQGELAFIRGLKAAFESVVGVIFAIPWGVMADKKGRRFVVAIAVLGLALSQIWYYVVCYFHSTLPPRAIWAGALFLVIGGGSPVAAGVIIGTLADAAAPDVRAQVLFYLNAANLVSMMVGPPIGAISLNHLGYWWPSLFGFAIELASCILIIWMPTVSQDTHRHVAGGEEETDDVIGIRSHDTEDSITTAKQTFPKRLWTVVASNLNSVGGVLELVFTNRTLGVGFLALTVTKVSVPISNFLPQFASKRFDWTISDASYISSIYAFASIIMLVLLLPTFKSFLQRSFPLLGPPDDLRMCRISIPFLALGCFLLGWAATPPLFVLALFIYITGIAYRPSLESFLSSAVRPDQMATLYVAISVVDTIGLMTTSPLIAAGFGEGLKRGATWIGLPFLVTSVLYVGSGVLTGFLRAGTRVVVEEEATPSEQDDDVHVS